ncbi:MAG: right-handed parallel beta-helix repeat-containing protein, partial [Ottowia sp.]|nr:right-handed parallel beta-helix repeat-containing protein [Ottowia sp.]
MVAPLGAVCAATLNVGPSGADAGNCQSTPCLTIGYALTQAAASGDTVLLAAGTYTEQITIAKSVTIEGAGSASTIVRAPAVLAVNPVISPGSGGQQTAIVFATGASTSAVMRNLQIRGPGPSSSGSIGYGVFVGGNANFTLDTAHITAIRDEPLAGSQNGSGIRFGAPVTSQVGSGQVLNSVIDDFQKNGITVSNTGSNVTVRGNTITGTLPPPIIAQNGIQVS